MSHINWKLQIALRSAFEKGCYVIKHSIRSILNSLLYKIYQPCYFKQ